MRHRPTTTITPTRCAHTERPKTTHATHCGAEPPGPGGDTVPRYESYVFDHAGVDGAATEGGIRYPDGGTTVGRSYVTLVASRAGAERRFDRSALDAGAASFVDNTSFDGAYLVVVQAFPTSSTPDFRVERVERRGEAIHLHLNRSSRYATADITVETVLVRVHGEPPDRAVVTTEGGDTFDSTTGVVTRTPDPIPTPDGVELPYASGDGSRRTVTASFGWRVEEGRGDAVVVVTDDDVRVEKAAAPAGVG